MKLIGLLALAAIVTAHASTPHLAGTVFLTERQLGTVSALDAATGVPLWTSATGARPTNVTVPHGTGRAYTSDDGSHELSVFDADTGARLGTIPMGPMPHHMMASRSGNRIYVGEFGHNQVGVVDTATDTRLKGFVASPLADARTHAVWITRNEKDLYATNMRANRAEIGDVARLNAVTGELLCNTLVGAEPSEVLVTPDSQTGYVSLQRENTVKELDLTGACPVLTGRQAFVGPQPDTLQLTNDGTTLVISLRGRPAQVSFLDTSTFVARIIAIPGHTTTGHHWLSANGKYSFVAVDGPTGVVILDNSTGATLADYAYPDPPGGNNAHGVFYRPSN